MWDHIIGVEHCRIASKPGGFHIVALHDIAVTMLQPLNAMQHQKDSPIIPTHPYLLSALIPHNTQCILVSVTSSVRDLEEFPRIPILCLSPSQHTVCPYVPRSLHTIQDLEEFPRIPICPSQHTVCPYMYVPRSLNTVRDLEEFPRLTH